MKPSLEKLQKIFKLEAERGYDNHAVLGGLERMLSHWEGEARQDNISEDLIQAVITRIEDYARLAEKSRAETLDGLLKRIQRSEDGISEESPETLQESREENILEAPEPANEPSTKTITPPADAAPQTTARASAARTPSGEPAALNAPVTVLQGVGPRYANTLERLGLFTLRDMFYHFPRRYDDYSKMKPINQITYGEELTVIGTVQNVRTRSLKSGNLKVVEAVVSDGSGALRVTWFNQVWIAKRLREGAHIVLAGKIEQYLGRLVMNNPEWEFLEQQQLSTNRIVPVYPLTSQITQRWMRRQMNQVVAYWAPRVQDPLPEEIRKSANVVDLPTALLQVHFPDSWEDLRSAQERLAFDEIFLLQLGVLRQKRAWTDHTSRRFISPDGWLETQLSRLPYTLTDAQLLAFDDIIHDLASGHPMGRLLQGDVGSGKTAVAALGIAAVAHQGAQAALMAPTSILAEQHYISILKMLSSVSPDQMDSAQEPKPSLYASQIRLMIGSTPESEKTEIRTGLENGSIKIVIGTHALIEEPVKFADLQLVVVDEQHRFGVEQRAALRSKGENPHLLVMTATPIPRSLALTIYGDLDLSIIDEMPPGRQPVNTYIIPPREQERAFSLIRSQIQEGRQAFIIYPLVEESEKSEAKAAVEEHEYLQNEVFPRLRLGLLHGRMRADEKDAIMSAFRKGEYHILVSTSVIEVGVDVPNASVMLIEGANRFGLAQLHQLRGRVGRGAAKSYCLLVPETPDAIENERLQVMTETNDGFILAERDLAQRGPGQFLGTRQSGYAEFEMANLTDIHMIEKARRHALELFEQDPELNLPNHKILAETLQRSWSGGKGDIS
jgi:ATP-dependent DNA helicase RecG